MATKACFIALFAAHLGWHCTLAMQMQRLQESVVRTSGDGLQGSAATAWARVTGTCDGDTDCKCKELLAGSICVQKDEKEKWSTLLRAIDANGDSLIDEAEFAEVGMKTEGNQDMVLPKSIDEVVVKFAEMSAGATITKLTDEGCGSDVEILRGMVENPSSQLTEYSTVCDKVHSASEDDDEIVREDELKVDEAETSQAETEMENVDKETGASLLQVEKGERSQHVVSLQSLLSDLSKLDQNLIRHDVDLAAIKYESGINDYLNFTALKAHKLNRGLRVASKEVAFAGVAKSFAALLSADFCWKDIWSRRTTHLSCKSGWYQGSSIDVGFCYKSCKSGYGRFGDHCWAHCPSGYSDHGTHCYRDGWIWVELKGKHIYYEPGCSITSSRCSGCPSGYYMAGLLCYENCKKGYWCSTDAALTGERICTQDDVDLPTDCALACASDTGACVRNTFEMIQGLIDAVVSSALLVISFGSSAAVTLPSATYKSIAKQTMKNQYKLMVRTAKKTFRDAVKGATRKKIKEAMIDNMKAKVEEKAQNLYVAYSLSESETLIGHYLDKFEKGDTGWDKANKVIQDIDPTGIAKAIDGSTGAETDDANKQVANWLNVISFVDPTGITGAVAGFIQHSHCEGTIKKMKAKVEAKITVAMDAS